MSISSLSVVPFKPLIPPGRLSSRDPLTLKSDAGLISFLRRAPETLGHAPPQRRADARGAQPQRVQGDAHVAGLPLPPPDLLALLLPVVGDDEGAALGRQAPEAPLEALEAALALGAL